MMDTALTFDDVLLKPGFADFMPKDASLATDIGAGISLNAPLISAAMDTVTEANMAIAMAQQGGLGIIHKNLSIDGQAELVLRVKKHESGIIRAPITLPLESTVADAKALMQKHQISGLPVIENGRLAGLITRRDLRYFEHMNTAIADVMTPRERLVTVLPTDNDPRTHKKLLHQHRIERLLVIDNTDDFRLVGMITVKDIENAERFPTACKDSEGQLRVGAATGVGDDARAEALITAGVDMLVVDTAHGHTKGVMDAVARIKKIAPHVAVMAGNVATYDGARALADAGADAVKVGMGPGSICTTRIIAGIGVPQITAISEARRALPTTPIIADGGIRFSGDICKAIGAGANAVMLGSIFAGTEETPGDIEFYQGRAYKSYRGMGSLGAMRATHSSSDRYFQEGVAANDLIPEGIEGRIPFKGSVHLVLHQLTGGIRAALGYTGHKSVRALMNGATLIRITGAGIHESHVHDVTITKEAPNYHIS